MLRRTLIAVALCGVAGGAFTGTSLVAQDRDPAQEEEVPPAAMAGDDMWNAALGRGGGRLGWPSSYRLSRSPLRRSRIALCL